MTSAKEARQEGQVLDAWGRWGWRRCSIGSLAEFLLCCCCSDGMMIVLLGWLFPLVESSIVDWLGFGARFLRNNGGRSCMIGLIQKCHSMSTFPMSHHKYNERFKKVEIGIQALKWSRQCVCESWLGLHLACLNSTADTKIE